MACKAWNERDAGATVQGGTYENPPALNSDTFTRIKFSEKAGKNGPVWDFVKDQCLHCKEPACVAACPVGALMRKRIGYAVPIGQRLYDREPIGSDIERATAGNKGD